MPHPHRSRSRQLHHPQTHGPQSDPKSSRQRQPAPQTQSRRMGRRLPRKSHRCMIYSPDSPAVNIDPTQIQTYFYNGDLDQKSSSTDNTLNHDSKDAVALLTHELL